MHLIAMFIRITMLAAMPWIVSGCAITPPPTFYQLEQPASAQAPGAEHGIIIGVGPVSLAAYLDRPQIVTRETAHTLKLSESNVWAEPLQDSIPRVIGTNLANILDTNRVFRAPRRDRALPLDFRVAIGISRFDGRLGGDVMLCARWTLYGQADRALFTRVSIIKEPTGAAGYDKLIAAQNRALQRLGNEIAETIRSAMADS
jgi:uncharacterized lipoprotein YmbA